MDSVSSVMSELREEERYIIITSFCHSFEKSQFKKNVIMVASSTLSLRKRFMQRKWRRVTCKRKPR